MVPVIVIEVGTEGAGAVGVLDESPPPHAVTRRDTSNATTTVESLGENMTRLRQRGGLADPAILSAALGLASRLGAVARLGTSYAVGGLVEGVAPDAVRAREADHA